MTFSDHKVELEELMGLLDGELTGAEAERVRTHVAGCRDCQRMEAEMRGVSGRLAAWQVEEAPASLALPQPETGSASMVRWLPIAAGLLITIGAGAAWLASTPDRARQSASLASPTATFNDSLAQSESVQLAPAKPEAPRRMDLAQGPTAGAANAVLLVRTARLTILVTGDFDAARATDGAYSCLLGFDNGVCASLVYSGYAHFDSDEFMGWIGEMGQKKDPKKYGLTRKALRGDELTLKARRNYGGPDFKASKPVAHQHFGLFVVSCEEADLRPLPNGVMIYGDKEQRLDALPKPKVARAEVVDELYAAVVEGKTPLHSGESAMATLAVCLAILKSAEEGRAVHLG